MKLATVSIVLIAAVSFLAACDSTAEQRIAQLQALHDRYVGERDRITRDIDIVQGIMSEAAIQLKEAREAGDDEKASQLEGILRNGASKLEQLTRAREQIDPILDRWREHLDEIAAQPNLNIGHEMQAVGFGLREVSPALPNPINTIAYIAGAALIGVGGVFAKRKDTEAKQNAAKAQALEVQAHEIVNSIDKAKSENKQFDKAFDQAKSIIRDYQSAETRHLVDHFQKS